jgi:hypothetical protein
MPSLKYNRLSQKEKDRLSALPVYIVLLIAGADGKIDEAEINKAVKLSRERISATDSDLEEFFDRGYQDFEDKLKAVISSLPRDKASVQKSIKAEIDSLNKILKNLDKNYVKTLTDHLKNLATQVAKASGGRLGFGAIGAEESSLINLTFLKG